MGIDDFAPDILRDFLTESGELLEQLEAGLVVLECSPSDPELLNRVFRALHTIKGSASFLALTNLVEIAHAAETALNAARSGKVVVGRCEMDLLLAAVDVLKAQFRELNAGRTELTRAESALTDGLVALGSYARPGAAAGDAGVMPDTPAAPGAGARTIELDASKADLIEHLIIDVQQNITQMRLQLGRLGDPGGRSGASGVLGELAEDLARTIDFFEIAECMTLASALERAFEGLESLSGAHLDQVRLRAMAVCAVLGEQAGELREMRLTSRRTAGLIERLTLAGEGRLDEALFVPSDTDDAGVLAFDGVRGLEAGPGGACDEVGQGGLVGGGEDAEPSLSFAEPSSGGVGPDPTATGIASGCDAGPKRAPNASEPTIRVEVGRLESLMNLVGELVLQKNRIGALSADVARTGIDACLIEQIEVAAGTLDRVSGEIQAAVMRTRMQPLEKIFGRYTRLIRDLAIKTGKQIQLVIEGGETEVDKSVIEGLGDPLVHLLRNSADHGIEPAAEREAAGKPATGTIRLTAGHEGSHVRVRITDDGRGLDRARIGAKAVDRGLCTQEELAGLSDGDVFRFVFEAGFSTADAVSDLSGRGVGMDVVRTNIERGLNGSVEIESGPGRGVSITITIPLTVAIMPALMVAVGRDVLAIPLASITEIVRTTPGMIGTIGGSRVMHLRGRVHPLLSAAGVLGLGDGEADEPFVVVISLNQKLIGLRVTRVIGQQEIVIKPLDGVRRDGPISGATVRNDGGVSLIIDVAELMRLSRGAHPGITAQQAHEEVSEWTLA